jgi:Tfp pilus assembly PilM family ATPase
MGDKGWAIDTLKVLIDERERYAAELSKREEKFQTERDRRYTELSIEREKALKIKETADLAALQLAREIQVYKDEKANELRSQIERERGSYLTREEFNIQYNNLSQKLDSAIKPLNDFVAANQGERIGKSDSSTTTRWIATTIVAVIAAFATLLYTINQQKSSGIHSTVVTCSGTPLVCR